MTTMFARARFAWLALTLILSPAGIEAAELRIAHLHVSREAFTLDQVELSCEIASRVEAASRGPLEARYRFRILDERSNCRWDSGEIRAPLSGRGDVQTPAVPVHCRLDSVSTAELSEIRIEVTAEVSGRLCRPIQCRFSRWADGRFRSSPEPLPWPNQEPVAALNRSAIGQSQNLQVAGSPMIVLTPRRTATPRVVLPVTHGSWGQLKARYR
jgi:hypothetical protein